MYSFYDRGLTGKLLYLFGLWILVAWTRIQYQSRNLMLLCTLCHTLEKG